MIKSRSKPRGDPYEMSFWMEREKQKQKKAADREKEKKKKQKEKEKQSKIETVLSEAVTKKRVEKPRDKVKEEYERLF